MTIHTVHPPYRCDRCGPIFEDPILKNWHDGGRYEPSGYDAHCPICDHVTIGFNWEGTHPFIVLVKRRVKLKKGDKYVHK